MPRIPPNIIESVFYLYGSREDALAGKNPGGTGFVVAYGGPFTVAEIPPYYGVTNWHVACRGDSVIRLNRRDGGIDVLDFGPDEWEFLPGKSDVAAIPLTLDRDAHKFSTVGTNLFAETPRFPTPNDISVGEDVFMVGLFLDHDGVTTNVPSARFGHVSMLPNEHATIKQPNGYRGISYVVDMHSRTGFSGSPVFAYRTFAGDLTEQWGHRVSMEIERGAIGPNGKGGFTGRLNYSPMFKFVGIHWGQFPEMWELSDKSRLEESSRAQHLIIEGAYVEGMSGMTCVIPAWQIKEVLDMPKFKTKRDASPKVYRSRDPKPESTHVGAADANPNHKRDFDALLEKSALPKDMKEE